MANRAQAESGNRKCWLCWMKHWKTYCHDQMGEDTPGNPTGSLGKDCLPRGTLRGTKKSFLGNTELGTPFPFRLSCSMQLSNLLLEKLGSSQLYNCTSRRWVFLTLGMWEARAGVGEGIAFRVHIKGLGFFRAFPRVESPVAARKASVCGEAGTNAWFRSPSSMAAWQMCFVS